MTARWGMLSRPGSAGRPPPAAGLGRQAHEVHIIHFKGPLPSFRV
jgi:hypothetical protein